MSIRIGDKALITTDEWFVASDGITYKAVFGTIKGVYNPEEVLGIKTNAKSTNWYVEIGSMVIAGCQIHYIIKTDTCNFDYYSGWIAGAGNYNKFQAPSSIFNADQ